jgi:hypothetical protein
MPGDASPLSVHALQAEHGEETADSEELKAANDALEAAKAALAA